MISIRLRAFGLLRLLGAAALAAALAIPSTVSALAASNITEYPVPGATPFVVTAGPDGNMWVSEGSKIARVTLSGAVTEFQVPTANSDPTFITTGPDGNLWFTELAFGADKVARVTTSGVITEFPMPQAGSGPIGITTGPDGNLWVTEFSDRIARMTTSGVVTEFSLPSTGNEPLLIVAGPDGNLWFTEETGNKVAKMTTAGVLTEFALPYPGSQPEGITAGPDGRLWITEWAGSRVTSVTTSGVIDEWAIPTQHSAPATVATGPDNKVWFSESGGGKMGVIDPFQAAAHVLTVNASDASRPYGSDNQNFGFSLYGLVNGDTGANSITGHPDCTSTSTPTSPAGSTYPITCTTGTLASSSYVFDFRGGTETIDKAPLQVSGNDLTRRYGSPNPPFTFTFSGFANGETPATANVTGSPNCSTSATPSSRVALSPYSAYCDVGTLAAPNYSFAISRYPLIYVTPAPLTVTANNKSRYFGAANPPFNATLSGFVNGETPSTSDVGGAAACSSPAGPSSPVGTYRINCSAGSLSSTNYNFSPFVSGTLTIKRAPTAVTARPVHVVPGPRAFQAHLVSQVTGAGIPGQTIAFSLGSSTTAACTAVTDSHGYASCTAPTQSLVISKGYVARFAGTANYLPSAGGATISMN